MVIAGARCSIATKPLIKESTVRSKVYITNGNLLRLTTADRLKTLLEGHHPATIAFVRYGEGVLTVIEAATPEDAHEAAAALAVGNLSRENLGVVPGDSPQGQKLAQLYAELTQRELEVNWTNRQW